MRAKGARKNVRIWQVLLRARLNFFGRKIGTFSPHSRKVKASLFISFPDEGRLFIYSILRSDYSFPKSASPLPSESNGRTLTFTYNHS